MMKTTFYKLRRNRAVSGVLAGLSDKFGLDVGLVRFQIGRASCRERV